MERIIIESVRIFDYIEKKAAKISFHDGLNVVTSDDTSRGKSSVIRAVYHGMGANSNYDKIFKSSEKIFEVSFRSGDEKYKIIRFKNKYVIFKNDVIVSKIDSQCSELSDFFEKEFKTAVYLFDRNNKMSIAPVTYLFIPYFLDQDKSWKDKIIPFKNADQFTEESLINLYYFHLGVLDINYFSSIKKKANYKFEMNSALKQKEILMEELGKVKDRYSIKSISIDMDSARIELDMMKSEIEKHLDYANQVQSKIYESESEQINIKNRLDDMGGVLKLLEDEKKKVLSTRIQCPNCAAFINLDEFDDFKTNYSIEFLMANIQNLNYEIIGVNEKLGILKESYLNITEKIRAIRNKYSLEKNTYFEYLNANAFSSIIEFNQKAILELNQKIVEIDHSLNSVEDEIETFAHKKQDINSHFKDFYLVQLKELGVVNVSRTDIDNFKKIDISGSQYTRSTLGFFFSFLNLKRVFNPQNYRFPLLLDSIFEGDPDGYNKADIIRDILRFYDSDEQMIIGMREADHYINFNQPNVYKIELSNPKGSLLTPSAYQSDVLYLDAIKRLIVDSF